MGMSKIFPMIGNPFGPGGYLRRFCLAARITIQKNAAHKIHPNKVTAIREEGGWSGQNGWEECTSVCQL